VLPTFQSWTVRKMIECLTQGLLSSHWNIYHSTTAYFFEPPCTYHPESRLSSCVKNVCNCSVLNVVIYNMSEYCRKVWPCERCVLMCYRLLMQIMASKMLLLLLLLQLIGVMMITIDSANAADCYDCSSDQDSGCYPLDTDRISTCEGGYCITQYFHSER